MFHLITPEPNKPFTIGRKEGSDLRFGDVFVSREHAVIERKGNSWFIKSLTSNSVTLLNDIDVDEAQINDGDIIVIGVRRLRATLNGIKLSLLLLDGNKEVESFNIDSNWNEIKSDFPETIKARLITALDQEDCSAELICCKKITLKNGDVARIGENEISFQDSSLHLSKVAPGFDVCVKNLDAYAGKKQLLQDINLELPAGEILAIIGRSGQGKSTFLRLLEGLLKKGEHSEVYIGGLDYRKKEIRKRIAFMAQEPALRKDLTVLETLIHGSRVSMDRSDFAATAMERCEKFLELFGLSERKNNRIQTLSGGEIRRCALAQELMGNPGLIVLDEPLSGLDPYNSKILCSHLKQLSFLGHTVILTTHSYEALQIANKVLVIHKGRQGFYGSPKDAFNFFKSSDPETILSHLDDDSIARWEETDFSSHVSVKKYSYVQFPKVHRCSNFFYNLGISAKQWFRDRGKMAALFLQPIIIGFLFSQIFSPQSNMWTVAFALILCCNWFALSLSIREIVQEKDIFRNEFRKGQSCISVLSGKLLLPALASFVQTLVVYEFVSWRISATPPMTSLLCIFATTVLPATAMGVLTSSLCKNSGQANAFLPLLIIPQVALAGALVPLDQMQPIGKILSTVIWSRYNQSSLLNVFLDRPDTLFNKISALALALGFYIITVFILQRLRKAK